MHSSEFAANLCLSPSLESPYHFTRPEGPLAGAYLSFHSPQSLGHRQSFRSRIWAPYAATILREVCPSSFQLALVSNYVVWRQGHIHVNNLPIVVARQKVDRAGLVLVALGSRVRLANPIAIASISSGHEIYPSLIGTRLHEHH